MEARLSVVSIFRCSIFWFGRRQFGHAFGDEAGQIIAGNFRREMDCRGVTQRISAAMAFDHAAVQPQKDAAVDASWVDPFTQATEGPHGEQSAKSGQDRMRKCVFHCTSDEPCSAFSGFQCDVAGETIRHDDIDPVAQNVRAFHEAIESEPGICRCRQGLQQCLGIVGGCFN